MVAAAGVLLAQAQQPDITGNLPSGTWLLAVLVIGLALYVSYRLRPRSETNKTKRREGPVSRALSEGTSVQDGRDES